MGLQNDILDYLGSEATEELLHKYYDGKTQDEILADLNEMFPQDENEDLAERIYEYLN